MRVFDFILLFCDFAFLPLANAEEKCVVWLRPGDAFVWTTIYCSLPEQMHVPLPELPVLEQELLGLRAP